jgi:hypothetical protein
MCSLFLCGLKIREPVLVWYNTMRKIGSLILMICMLLASCKKSNTTISAGTWTFQSSTFHAGICTGASSFTGTLTAAQVSNSDFCYISCIFYNSLPTTNGSYNVVAYNAGSVQLSPGQAYLQMVIDSDINMFTSTGGDGKEKLNVSVSNGKVSASGSGIEMAKYINPSDSSPVTFNITRTQ